MRRLAGGFLRTFANHRTPEGYAYREILRAKVEALGPLPKDARVTLREYGRLVLDMQRLHEEQDRAVARGHVTMARRIAKRLTPMRTQLAAVEERLDGLAGRRSGIPATPSELLTVIERGRGAGERTTT